MLHILKKTEGSRHGVGGVKGKSLEPPKNLPDLARDIYEREPLTSPRTNSNLQAKENSPTSIIASNNTSIDRSSFDNRSVDKPLTQTAQNNLSNTSNNYQNNSFQTSSKPLVEPDKDSVPRLDLSLVRQHLASSQSAIQSIPGPVQSLVQQTSNSVNNIPLSNYTSQGIPLAIAPETAIRNTNSFNGSNVNNNTTINRSNNSIGNGGIVTNDLINNINLMDDSTGFFKEFEEYVRTNGLDNEVVDDLLGRNWLDHISFYHTTKGEDMPFYASSAELSHAIKLKLEDLQNLERNWIINKQKVDLLKKLSSTLESDIHLKSEELKKLIIESKKRGSVSKPTDFFQIAKPRFGDSIIKESSSKELVSKDLLSNDLDHTSQLSTVSHQSSLISPQSNLIVPRSTVIPLSTVITPSTRQPPIAQRYVLTKYVTDDSSKYFYAQDGRAFKSLSELIDGLESMNLNTFNYHVTPEKNDFSNWIKGVFGDFRLSDVIRSLDKRENLWHYLKNSTI